MASPFRHYVNWVSGTAGCTDDSGPPPTTTWVLIQQQNKWESRTLNGNDVGATDATQSIARTATFLNDGLPLSDTVGRSITYAKSTSGTTTTETFTLLDSNGSAKVYTVTWNSVPARSPGQLHGCSPSEIT
jgi:hypothetical protein